MNMRAFLEDLGLHVLEASRGAAALRICATHAPDLVMLDINMPGLDGFQVCSYLKADPATADIPVLFLSGLLSIADKLEAFRCGGSDYITKPFQFAEVEARLRTHLRIRRQERELREQYEALRHLENLRDSFTHMVAHDMRGPLTGILASLELSLHDAPPDLPRLRKKLELALGSASMLSAMINQMLELSRMESRNMPLEQGSCDLSKLLSATLDSFRPAAGRRTLTADVPGRLQVWCDPSVIGRVLGNLLDNALTFTAEDGSILLKAVRSGPAIRVEVTDDGPGIPAEHHATIFEKFRKSPAGARVPGVGLGLAFCKSALAAHQGEIGLESRPDGGCTFWFTLRAVAPGASAP